MARKRTDPVGPVVAEVERVAKRLRADMRKRAKNRPLLKALLKTAERLRDRAAAAAGRVEKHLHRIRMELAAVPHPARAGRRVRRTRAA
jgi:hypothetical protein